MPCAKHASSSVSVSRENQHDRWNVSSRLAVYRYWLAGGLLLLFLELLFLLFLHRQFGLIGLRLGFLVFAF